MRLQINFKTKVLPVYYRNLFISLIKQAIKNVDTDYFNQLYHYGSKNNKAPKPFCFAGRFLFDRERFKENKGLFYPHGDVHLYLSSPDPAFIARLYNGLLGIKTFPYQNFELERGKIIMLNERNISENAVTFKTLSPILIEKVENGKERPILPIDKKTRQPLPEDNSDFKCFLKELNYIGDKTLAGVKSALAIETDEKGLKEELNFIPLKLRKEVIRHKVRERNKAEKIYTFTCFSGQFKLIGHPEDLKLLYQLGIGLRRAQGFGMVEVLG